MGIIPCESVELIEWLPSFEAACDWNGTLFIPPLGGKFESPDRLANHGRPVNLADILGFLPAMCSRGAWKRGMPRLATNSPFIPNTVWDTVAVTKWFEVHDSKSIQIRAEGGNRTCGLVENKCFRQWTWGIHLSLLQA